MTPLPLTVGAEQNPDEIHPLLQPPVLQVLFKYLNIRELDICKQVCRTWYEVSREDRLPWEKQVIEGAEDLEVYLSEVRRGIVPIHRRFTLKNLDFDCETVSRFFATHQFHFDELRIHHSCRSESVELLTQIRFPKLLELLRQPPVIKCQYTVLPKNELGPSPLRKLTLEFTEFDLSTKCSFDVISSLRLLPDLDILHITGEIAADDTIPVFVNIHPGNRMKALYLLGSAMRLPIYNFVNYFMFLSYLEMDGLHQLEIRGYRARILALKTLVLRNETMNINEVNSLEQIFPELKNLSVTLRNNRGKSFLPMVFRMKNLESLQVIGNFTDKMICGTSSSKSPMDSSSLGASIWRKFKKAIVSESEPRRYIFSMKSLQSLSLRSPLLTRTVVLHGLRLCDNLLLLNLNMNPNHSLDMPAMDVLGQLTNLTHFRIHYPEQLRWSPEDILTFLKRKKRESEYGFDRRTHYDNVRKYRYSYNLL